MQATTAHSSTDTVTSSIEGSPSLRARVSWGAILAGATVAITLGLMLNALGTGIAGTLVDATARDTPTASSFGIGAGLWMLASHLFAIGVGAYVAARLSGTTDGKDGVFHGIAVWGTTFLVMAVIAMYVVSSATSAAVTGASNMVGGLARGAGSLLSVAGEQVANRTGTEDAQSMANALVERAQNALNGGGSPSSMTADQRRAEITSLITDRVTDGELGTDQRNRLSELVAAEYQISPDEANQRIDQVEQRVQDAATRAEEQARMAADTAAHAAAIAAFSIFLTMLAGLGAAILGGSQGTRELLASYSRVTMR